MTMKFLDFLEHEDFGKEYFFNLLQYKRFCAFQFMFDFTEYSGSTGLIVSVGHSSVFGLSLHILNFGFSFDFLTWKARQLDYWRQQLDYYLKNNDSCEITSEKTNS